MRKWLALLAAPVLLLAAGCVAQDGGFDAPSQSDAGTVEGYGPPLPDDVILERPGEVPPPPTTDVSLVGSLRPDDLPPAERVPEIFARGRLIVGIDQSLNLISYRDPATGDLVGFEVALAHELARDIFGDPSRVEFRYLRSADRLTAVQEGTVDVVIRTMTITPERQDQVLFSTPYLTVHSRLLVDASSAISGPADLAGRTVCVADGSTGLLTARQVAPQSNLLRTQSWSDCLVAMQQHQADVILSDDAQLSGIVAQDAFTRIVGPELNEDSYGIAASQDNPGLIRQVNSTIERIRADGTWNLLFNTWFSAWLPNPGPPPLNYREEDPDA